VDEHRGQWDQDDWLELLADLEAGGLGPVDLDALKQVLHQTAAEWQNLRRWQESGAARRWVEEQQGRWDDDGWLSLLGMLQWAGLWPIDLEGVARLVAEARAEWFYLRARQEVAAARRWPEADLEAGAYDGLRFLETTGPVLEVDLAADVSGPYPSLPLTSGLATLFGPGTAGNGNHYSRHPAGTQLEFDDRQWPGGADPSPLWGEAGLCLEDRGADGWTREGLCWNQGPLWR
jgi:hypothetical protein